MPGLRPLDYLFLGALTAGAIATVRVLVTGIERREHLKPADPVLAATRPHQPGTPEVRMLPPVVAAFLVAFGVAGYVAIRSGQGMAGGISVATVAGAASAFGMLRLARGAARMVPEHDEEDPRFVLQGHPARVTATIPAGGEGRIAFTLDGVAREARAISFNGSAIAPGTDVVIEQLDVRGVATVEPWLSVERRL